MNRTGTVVSRYVFLDGEEGYGVDFGIHHRLFHRLDGLLQEPTGRYILTEYLEIKEREI